ncbi:MAG: hypothetical protein KAR44_02935 [Candidatus Aegiribacteria sp.]|nr:hypothetical protein [Candidatus Aegiribacteria sp.]
MNIVSASILKRIIYFFKFIIFFLGPGMLYHYLKKKQTWKRLEQYTKDNKIKRELTSSYDDFGELHWESHGRPVTVRICYDNPSFGPWISVGLKLNTQILRLHTYKPMNRPGSGWEEFTSPSPEFNYLYESRQVRSDYRDKLLNSFTIFDDIVKFYSDWILYLSNDIGTNGLVVDGEEVRFVFGPSAIRSMFPYVTPEEIEAVLPDMIELAEKFDRIFQPDGE